MELPHKIEQAEILAALERKNATGICTSCSSNNWTMVSEAALLMQWTKVLPAPGIPLLAAICNNCGYMRLHALAPLGLLPPDTKLEGSDG